MLGTNKSVRGNSWILFNQEALPKFCFVSRVDILLTIGDRHWRKLAVTFNKAESANSFHLYSNGCLFMWGAYFCKGAYERNVVVVIKMGAYQRVGRLSM